MPAADTLDIDTLAHELLAARQQRQALPSLLARYPDLTPAHAYAVAEAIALQRQHGGEQSVGRKIGMTNRTAWEALGASAPIWGHVYDSTLVMAPKGRAVVSLDEALSPRIEPEIGFCLRSAVNPGETDPRTLLACIAWVAPCFEIIDCHVGGWKFKAVEAIADFGVHYRLVVGAPQPVSAGSAAAADALVQALGQCQATLECNGAVVERGLGSTTLGNPLYALGALVDVLAAHAHARPLRAGEIITTGTLTTPQPVSAGQQWRLSFEGLALEALELNLA